jgi:hypothetical protein
MREVAGSTPGLDITTKINIRIAVRAESVPSFPEKTHTLT